MEKPQEENCATRTEICDAFKQMTLIRIQHLSRNAVTTPDEIRAVRECVETIMHLCI